jgi:3-hydroxy-9,10-secoandrosta-1,3,5(10)-triene-9,17-dione monooxygenase
MRPHPAAKLQITGSLDAPETAPWALARSVARARDAADRLLASSRHALDASDPVTNRWRDVHPGCRLAARILDGLPASS